MIQFQRSINQVNWKKSPISRSSLTSSGPSQGIRSQNEAFRANLEEQSSE